MRVGRAILRGVKLAAYAFAGLLVCIVVYNVMTLSPESNPASPDPDPTTLAESVAGNQGPPTVPPPPPLPGHAQAKSAAQGRRAPVQSAAKRGAPGTQDAVRIREVDTAEVSSPAPAELNDLAGPAPAESATVAPDGEAPAGIVIVRPPEHAPRDNRGRRWIKAVGRALHFGQ